MFYASLPTSKIVLALVVHCPCIRLPSVLVIGSGLQFSIGAIFNAILDGGQCYIRRGANTRPSPSSSIDCMYTDLFRNY